MLEFSLIRNSDEHGVYHYAEGVVFTSGACAVWFFEGAPLRAYNNIETVEQEECADGITTLVRKHPADVELHFQEDGTALVTERCDEGSLEYNHNIQQYTMTADAVNALMDLNGPLNAARMSAKDLEEWHEPRWTMPVMESDAPTTDKPAN